MHGERRNHQNWDFFHTIFSPLFFTFQTEDFYIFDFKKCQFFVRLIKASSRPVQMFQRKSFFLLQRREKTWAVKEEEEESIVCQKSQET